MQNDECGLMNSALDCERVPYVCVKCICQICHVDFCVGEPGKSIYEASLYFTLYGFDKYYYRNH